MMEAILARHQYCILLSSIVAVVIIIAIKKLYISSVEEINRSIFHKCGSTIDASFIRSRIREQEMKGEFK